MTRNDRHCPNSNNHDGYYQSMSRLYLRKSISSKTGKHGQQYVPFAWLCEGCGTIVIEPVKCKKCESKNIIRVTSSWARDPKTTKAVDFKFKHYNDKTGEHKWYCFDCKFSWHVKLEKKNHNFIQLI